MIKRFLKKNPIAGYYLIAIAFPTVLFSYMMVMEIVWQGLYGADQSYAMGFFAARDGLIEQYPNNRPRRSAYLRDVIADHGAHGGGRLPAGVLFRGSGTG